MVDVNTQNKTISVNVSSSGVSSNVNASGDTTMYYSNKAKEWAISNKIIDGVDYSSKYYAEKSKEYSEEATQLTEKLNEASSVITNTTEQAIAELGVKISVARDNALGEIETTGNSALSDISASQAETLVKIGEAKIDALNEINSSVEGYKSSALDAIEAKSIEEQAVIVAIKDDVLNSTNEASDYKEEAKYWAEKAKDNSGIYYDEIGEQDISVSILEAGYVTNETLNETIGDISTVLDDILGGV